MQILKKMTDKELLERLLYTDSIYHARFESMIAEYNELAISEGEFDAAMKEITEWYRIEVSTLLSNYRQQVAAEGRQK